MNISRPSSTSLREAIEEFSDYSVRTSSLCERTATCFQEIHDKIATDEAEEEQTLIPSEQLQDVEKELQKRPSVLFIGERNSGKSSVLNELLRQTSLPVHENPCTSRIVRIKYAERCYAKVIGPDGEPGEEVNFEGKRLPAKLIVVSDSDREKKEALEATVEIGLNHELLKSGIELIDSPGKNESEALDAVLDDFLQKDTVPLFVYVVDGNMQLRPSDKGTITLLKDRFPHVPFMYVCNKVDITAGAESHDNRSGGSKHTRMKSDDDEDGDGDNDDGDDNDGDDDGDDGNGTFKKKKGETVFEQLKESGFVPKVPEDSWESSSVFHAISAREVRTERLAKKEAGPATSSFRRFESVLQNLLTDIIKKQTRRAVQKLLFLQESFVNVVQVQRSRLTDRASVFPQIFQKANDVETKMFESLSAIGLNTEESRRTIVENLQGLEKTFKAEADKYKVVKKQTLRDECQTMVKTEIGSLQGDFGLILQLATTDLGLARFVSDMKGSILEKTHNTLDAVVQDLMRSSIGDLTNAIISFNSDLCNPIVNRILEDSYDIQCIADNLEASQTIQVVLNGLLDSMSEAVNIALRKEISEPLSKCFALEEVSSTSNLDVNKKSVRRRIVDILLATIKHDRIVEAIREACSVRLLTMHELFQNALAKLNSLNQAFAEGALAAQLEDFRVNLTPRVRELAVEGIALQNFLKHGPVELGPPIAQTRHATIYDCTSERWCRDSSSGQCAVKVLRRKELDDAIWRQTAVDLVNTMDIIQKLRGSHPNLLRLFGWLLPEPGVLYLVMEKAEKGLLAALQGSLSPIMRMNIALDVATGLKAIHDADYIYEDLKPENILLMPDGTAKINLAKPENPKKMTALGAPFHISPEMHRFHGTGQLSCSSYDIYAFGMLFWVLCEGSGNSRPEVYLGLSAQEMEDAVVRGVLPERPSSVTDDSWNLMTRCWQHRKSVTMGYVLAEVEKIRKACWDSM